MSPQSKGNLDCIDTFLLLGYPKSIFTWTKTMGRSRPNFSPKLEPIHRTKAIHEQFGVASFDVTSQNQLVYTR